MGGLKQTPVDKAIRDAEDEQQNERENDAYEKGKERHGKNQSNPGNDGGPKGDGYEGMTSGERDAYKKGHRGD